jgi:hypothetical protein
MQPQPQPLQQHNPHPKQQQRLAQALPSSSGRSSWGQLPQSPKLLLLLLLLPLSVSSLVAAPPGDPGAPTHGCIGTMQESGGTAPWWVSLLVPAVLLLLWLLLGVRSVQQHLQASQTAKRAGTRQRQGGMLLC